MSSNSGRQTPWEWPGDPEPSSSDHSLRPLYCPGPHGWLLSPVNRFSASFGFDEDSVPEGHLSLKSANANPPLQNDDVRPTTVLPTDHLLATGTLPIQVIPTDQVPRNLISSTRVVQNRLTPVEYSMEPLVATTNPTENRTGTVTIADISQEPVIVGVPTVPQAAHSSEQRNYNNHEFRNAQDGQLHNPVTDGEIVAQKVRDLENELASVNQKLEATKKKKEYYKMMYRITAKKFHQEIVYYEDAREQLIEYEKNVSSTSTPVKPVNENQTRPDLTLRKQHGKSVTNYVQPQQESVSTERVMAVEPNDVSAASTPVSETPTATTVTGATTSQIQPTSYASVVHSAVENEKAMVLKSPKQVQSAEHVQITRKPFGFSSLAAGQSGIQSAQPTPPPQHVKKPFGFSSLATAPKSQSSRIQEDGFQLPKPSNVAKTLQVRQANFPKSDDKKESQNPRKVVPVSDDNVDPAEKKRSEHSSNSKQSLTPSPSAQIGTGKKQKKSDNDVPIVDAKPILKDSPSALHDSLPDGPRTLSVPTISDTTAPLLNLGKKGDDTDSLSKVSKGSDTPKKPKAKKGGITPKDEVREPHQSAKLPDAAGYSSTDRKESETPKKLTSGKGAVPKSSANGSQKSLPASNDIPIVQSVGPESKTPENTLTVFSFPPHITVHSPRGSAEYNAEMDRLSKLVDSYVEKIRIPLLSRLAFHNVRKTIHPLHDRIVEYWKSRSSYGVKKQRNDAKVMHSIKQAIERNKESTEEFCPTIKILLEVLSTKTDDVIIMDTIWMYADHNLEEQPDREKDYLQMLESSINWNIDPFEEITPVGLHDLDHFEGLTYGQSLSIRNYINRQFLLRHNINHQLPERETQIERAVRNSYNELLGKVDWPRSSAKTRVKVEFNTVHVRERIGSRHTVIPNQLSFLYGINSSIIDFDCSLWANGRNTGMSTLYPLQNTDDLLSLYFS